MDINANVELWKFFKNYTNPYTDMAYGRSIDVTPKYLNPQGDSLSVLAEISNPQNHPIDVFALVRNDDSTFQDSIQLFDNGNPNDNNWVGSEWFSGLAEEEFVVELSTRDLLANTSQLLHTPSLFTTIGPVEIERYEIPFISPGGGFYLKLWLRNDGQVATANNIKAVVSSNDPNITNITPSELSFGNIGPQQNVTSNDSVQFHTQNDPDSVKIAVLIKSGNYPYWGDSDTLYIVISGIEDQIANVPTKYSLGQNYPNPFNPITTIEFDLLKTSEVTLKVFNILGEELVTLVSDKLSAGSYSYEWNALGLASGVYLYRLKAGDYVETRKMVLMR